MNKKTTKPHEISDEKLMELITLIGKPSLEYMLKRVQNKLIQDKINSSLNINSFLSIVIGALAVINASTLKWLSCAPKEKIGEDIDIDNLRLSLISNINSQLGIVIN